MTECRGRGTTPSQTVGPFLSLGLTWPDGPYVVPEGAPGAIRIGGRVLDGEGKPVPDAMVETWQADPAGRFDHPDDPRGAEAPAVRGFRGFGRSSTDPDGQWWVLTVKPGSLPGPGETTETTEAPHLDLSVFARGLMHQVVTRIYFPDEGAANDADPVLRTVPVGRRPTLIASATDDGLCFDIRLQGDHETVFFTL